MRKKISISPPTEFRSYTPSQLFKFFFQLGRWTEENFSADFQTYTRGTLISSVTVNKWKNHNVIPTRYAGPLFKLIEATFEPPIAMHWVEAFEVKPNGKLGLAVFATDNIPSGSTIAVFTGERYHSETELELPEIMRDYTIQTAEREHVFGYKGLAHRLCHSCDPNCGIRNLTEIFAVRDIAKDEQITWDYRCSENSNWVLHECLCGSDRCTGSVKNYDSLAEDIKAEYLSKGMVSEWLSG